jgi:TPR repeat protein
VVQGYAQSCDGRDLPFCVAVASLYEGGFGVTRDDDKARELHRLTCQRGHQAGCRRYAVSLLRAHPEPQLQAEARQLLQQACHQPRTGPGACVGGQAQACYDLGLLVDEGVGGGAVPSHALALYDRACREDSALGCALAAQRRWENPASAAELQRAHQIYDELASRQGFRALQAAVVMQSSPHELPRPDHALTLMLQICERGNRSACAQAGVLSQRAGADTLKRLRAGLERDCAQDKRCKARDLLRLHTAGR